VLLFTWIIPDSQEKEARGHKKNSKLKHNIWKSYKNLMRAESTIGAT
jgi:hypothetical protein